MEGEMPQHFLSKDKPLQGLRGRGAEPHSAKKEKGYAPKRFDQTFLKFETWCKSMKGLIKNKNLGGEKKKKWKTKGK